MSASITAILPTHDRRESLLRALRSILWQTRPPEQILVVADGCSDGSVEAVRELGEARVEVLDMPKGPGLGWGDRNLALERATGELVAYLSDDDLWLPDHLERVGELFDAQPCDLVQASSCRVAESGELELFAMDWADPRSRELLLSGLDSRTPMSAVSHRTGLAAEAGGWSSHPPIAPGGFPKGDLDLWQRMVRRGARTAIVREVTVVHPPSLREGFERRGEEQRARDHRQLFDRIAEPGGVARLRLEIARAAYRGQAGAEDENRRLREDRERAEQYARSLEQVLRARDEEIAGLSARLAELEGRD